MGLSSLTGVLSRYFVLGFFVPSFFTLFGLSQLLTSDFVPNGFEELKDSTKVLVLGAGALLIGLFLLGLRLPITRLFQGYLFASRPVDRVLGRPLVWSQRRVYDRLKKVLDDPQASSEEKTRAARDFDRRFHHDRGRVLPTRFGNAYLAYESYSFTRWGLDATVAWPRIDPLLNQHERELHTHAASDLAFFVNAALGGLVGGIVLVLDGLISQPVSGWSWLAYAAPFVGAYGIYHFAAVGAMERQGSERRASIDLHRRELYERMGVRAPLSFTEERKEIAREVNRCILYGVPIRDKYARRRFEQR